jgi:uncharacterized Zn finger protein (UPF0148 family)
MSNNLRREVALLCPTCGSNQFRFEQGSEFVECDSCQRRLQKDELVRENQEAIQEGGRELAREAIGVAQKEFKESLRRAFAGSKYIKIR